MTQLLPSLAPSLLVGPPSIRLKPDLHLLWDICIATQAILTPTGIYVRSQYVRLQKVLTTRRVDAYWCTSRTVIGPLWTSFGFSLLSRRTRFILSVGWHLKTAESIYSFEATRCTNCCSKITPNGLKLKMFINAQWERMDLSRKYILATTWVYNSAWWQERTVRGTVINTGGDYRMWTTIVVVWRLK